MSLRDRLRGFVRPVPVPVAAAPAPDLADTNRRLETLTRQVAALRGLVQQQGELTVEALGRAGWQSPEEVADQVALQKALRVLETTGDVIAGPWTGEVGFEVLYWIPFLHWLVEQGLDRSRLVVVSRGGAAPWYRHLTDRYVDLLDLMTPDEFRERTAGPKKQRHAAHAFDRELVEAVKGRQELRDVQMLHPAVMYRLFEGVWRKRAGVDRVLSFTSHRPFVPPPPVAGDEIPGGLPAGYVAAKFYFSKAFPDTGNNRAFVGDLLRRVTRDVPVLLLSTAMRLDEHTDFQAAGGSGVYVIDPHREPSKNLDVQTRVIAGARGFLGTYGGFSYVAPFVGVRSLSFFSRRDGFESHHLQLADRVFDQVLPGGFVALDRRALGLVEPAVAGWISQEAERVTT